MQTSGAGTCGTRKISSAPPDRHGLTTTHAPGASGNVHVPVGQHPQQHALAGLQRAERGLAHRVLRALPADEALDGAVGQHDRLVAGVRRGRLLRAHDRGVHERRPRAPQLLGRSFSVIVISVARV